jgi:hypothetical protein
VASCDAFVGTSEGATIFSGADGELRLLPAIAKAPKVSRPVRVSPATPQASILIVFRIPAR